MKERGVVPIFVERNGAFFWTEKVGIDPGFPGFRSPMKYANFSKI